MSRLLSGLILSVALAAPQTALAFKAKKGNQVNPVNAAVFEVVSRGAASGPTYWCGAGDYANRALKAPWSATIYLSRSRGPSETTNKKSAVQFTLDPAAAGITPTGPSLSLNALKVGDSMSVQQAYSYCNLGSGRL